MLVSALLLLVSIISGFPVPSHGIVSNQKSLVNRQLPVDSIPAIATGETQSISSAFGREDLAVNFTSVPTHRLFSKRATPKETRGYRNFVCAGEKYLEAIKDAFEGRTPVKRIPPKELDNGWTKQNVDAEDEEFKSVENRWKAAFEDLFGRDGGYPPRNQIESINLIQNQRYQTVLGVEIKEPTIAYSYGFYYPNRNLIMSTSSYSATEKINERYQGISKADRNAKLPTISALSDLMWLAWNMAAPPAPHELRYIARDIVSNDESSVVISYLLTRDKGDPRDVPWPGVEYSGDSDEGKALLASPNGRATAWLLIDHAGEMDWRVRSRQVKVNIFSVFGQYCMLWDMEPQSPRGTHKRSLNRQSLGKRAPIYSDDFDIFKDKGDIAVREIEAAQTGCVTTVKDYAPDAFQNGWTRVKDGKDKVSEYWAKTFRDLGSPTTEDTTNHVEMRQDKAFTNNKGASVDVQLTETMLYSSLYMPLSHAILVLDMISPSSRVQRYYADRGPEVPSNQAINDNLVPPLHRWSDATWTLWKEKGGTGNLRYIAHDYVSSDDTESVMTSIVKGANKEPKDLPFPGLVFTMDTQEGRALLGTPNGIGVAHLLIDRASTLGKRDLRIHIFYANDPRPAFAPNYPCMLFDMAPTQA
ncbi:MAG: hypothetical protein Q9223_001998 [Gallowayella weberi]